ncbi:MAG TPA: hypothetical protein PKA81_00985 [Clostridia bacterium]|nr:hypothetical protein [Clostridia bacterium]
MISVLGLPLARAKELLAAKCAVITITEARSKKGVPGGSDARVIRQTQTGEAACTLVYSVFRIEPEEPEAQQ